MALFDPGVNDLHGVRRARDVVYVRQLGRALGVLGAWPGEGRTRPGRWRRVGLFVYVWFPVLPLFFGGLVNSLGGDAKRIGHNAITCLISCVGMTRHIMFFSNSYWELIDKFLEDVHLFNYKHQNEHFLKEHIAVHVRCTALWRTMSLILPVGIVLYNTHPLYVNMANGAYSGADVVYVYAVDYAIPHLDLERQLVPHIVFSVLNVVLCSWCVSANWLPDLLSMMMVLHIWGHMRVLGHEMKRFTEDTEKAAQGRNQLNEQESITVRDNLKQFAVTHRKILSYVKATNKAFSGVYFFYFAYFQVALCIMMWQCSQGMEGLMQYGVLTASSIFSLSLLCVVMEMISTQNDALARSVYALPWHLMRVPERRTVLIMLMRVQSPLRMKALGLTDIGVSTLSKILRTSISYFMILRSKA